MYEMFDEENNKKEIISNLFDNDIFSYPTSTSMLENEMKKVTKQIKYPFKKSPIFFQMLRIKKIIVRNNKKHKYKIYEKYFNKNCKLHQPNIK